MISRGSPATRLILSVGVLLLLLAVTGCPLGPQSRPVPVPVPVPTEPVTSTSQSRPAQTPTQTQTVTVYLVADERLSAARRDVEPGLDPVTAALTGLARGTDAAERARRQRSALPPNPEPPTFAVSVDTVELQLPATFDQLDTRDQVLAIGQIVYSITESGTVQRVSFARRSTVLQVPDGDGRLTSRPVSRADYAAIAPR